MNYAKFKTDEDEQPSLTGKITDFLDAHQVKIQLVTIYAGLIGIVLEGNYSNYNWNFGHVIWAILYGFYDLQTL